MKKKGYSKMVGIFALVLAMVTLSWFALPATLCYAQGGYEVAPGVGAGTPHPGFTSLIGEISIKGIMIRDVIAESPDGLCQLTINKGTKALTKWSERLSAVITVEMKKPPAPPPDTNVIGLVYDFRPEGATFDPPIGLTFTYDPALIAEGVAEKDLVLAMWDKEVGEWVVLVGCAVDPVTNTITAKISHFTAFTIIAYTRPAEFTASDLTISPAVVDIGETVTISALIANSGDLASIYEVTLMIDNEVVDTKEVVLAGGISRTVTFTTAGDVAGTCDVNVDGLSGKFTVKAPPAPPPPAPAAFVVSVLTISPTEVDIGQSVTISILVANTGDVPGSYEVTLKLDNVAVDTREVTLEGGASQTVTFTTSSEVAGTYTVNVSGLSGTFTVKAAPPLPPPINWRLVGGILAACIIITVVIWQVAVHRRA